MNIRSTAAALARSLPLLGTAVYATTIEPARVEVTHIPVPVPGLPAAFAGWRIAQMSDIHLARWMNHERLAGLVALINAQGPDLVALTGDFVTAGHAYRPADLTAALGRLQAPGGVYAVLGNHDHKHAAGPEPVRAALAAAGITVLTNAVHTLRRDGAALHIAGVDDVSRLQARLDVVLAALPEDGPALLLAHEPDFAAISAPTNRFALQLSGHSHGGQIVLFNRPVRKTTWAQRYWRGRYALNGMQLYVNRGVGMVGGRVRLNARPEITLLTLQSA